MNKYLITIGSICTVLWAFMTAMTKGIPVDWCIALDRMTFSLMSDSVFRMANGFFYDVSNNEMPTIMFLILFFVIFALTAFLFFKIEKGCTKKSSLWIILFFSVLFRVIVLPGELIHENDIYRYLWDGKTLTHRVNPYKYAPADLLMVEEEEGRQVEVLIQQRKANPRFFERIGHPEVPTIYPPLMQVLFAFSVWIKGDSILFMKFLFVLFDVGVIWLIVKFLKYFKKDPCLCLLYGWSPLVLKEFANSGHYDAVAVFFALLGLYWVLKKQNFKGVTMLALATLSKFFALVLLPVLKIRFKKRDFFIYGLIMIGAYLPFIVMGNTGLHGVFQGFLTYNREWAYNGSIFALVSAIFKHFLPLLATSLLPAKVVVGFIYAGILYFLSRGSRRENKDILHRCFLSIAALFILSPVGDPWYFCWVMPFLCIFPYRSGILLSGLIVLSYLNFRSDIFILEKSLFYIPVLSWMIYMPFFVLAYVEQKRWFSFLYVYDNVGRRLR